MTGPEIFGVRSLPYPPLPESHKKRYPFAVAAPSFIYPDHILPNALMLAPFVDEIELLLFESHPPENLPPAEDIRQLAEIAETWNITYNVHLPIDVNITVPGEKERTNAISRTVRALECTQKLAPTTWTLHLAYTEKSRDAAAIHTWQQRAAAAAEQFLSDAKIPPRKISIETLDYPPAWLAPIARALDLSICLDIGHLMEHGHDIADTYRRFADRLSIVHLYGGVIPGRGHISLDYLPEAHVLVVRDILSRFTGTVSLEVFSYEELKASLTALQRIVCNPD